MKTIILTVLMATLANTSALADGFKCEGVNTGINVKVFNHTDPSVGTRALAVMIVSDPTVNSPNKTVAKFSDENHTLSYLGYGKFEARVDLRYTDSDKKGENIAGTKLGELANIDLEVSNNSKVLDKGTVTNGKITYTKRTGETIEENANCVRYLKN